MTWPTISFGARFTKASATWTELGSYAERINTRQGRSRFLERHQAGTIDAELANDDRRFDPLNLSGPYVSGGVTQVEPMVQVLLLVTHAAVDYAIKFGFVDSWRSVPQPPEESVCTVSATDGFKLLARATVTATDTGGGSDTAADAILDCVPSTSWIGSAIDLVSPDMLVPNYVIAAGTNALSEMQRLAETGRGDLFMAPGFIGGRWVDAVQYRPWHLRKTVAVSAVWSDDPTGADLLYEFVEPLGTDDDQYLTSVTGQRVGGVAQTVVSAGALVANADVPSVKSVTGLSLGDDSDVANWATGILHRFSAFEVGFGRMVVDLAAQDSDTVWVAALSTEIGDRITVQHTPPGGGTEISRDHFVEGIAHSIVLPQLGRSEGWKVEFALSDATRFKTSAWMIGSATRGKIGSASLG